MPSVLISVPFAFGIRNFVTGGLCSSLQREIGPVSLLSPYPQEFFSSPNGDRFSNYHLPATEGEGGIPCPSGLTKFDIHWKWFHTAVFAQEFPHGSLQMLRMATNRNVRWWLAYLFRKIAPRGSTQRRMFRSLNQLRKPRRKNIQEIFDKLKPSLVVVSSPGHFWSDMFVMEEAERRRIPVLCVVLSWDNLYSRGPLVRRPDYMAVWSSAMRKQAEVVHSFPPNRIEEVGALQFGPYAEEVTECDIQCMRTRIGIPAKHQYIAYVCGARTAQYDVEDVLAMLKVFRGSEYESVPIVLRPHPQGSRVAYDQLREYGVLIDVSPDLTDAKTPPDAINREAVRHMAAFLKDARFVVSSWGTTALLEASILGTPTVQLRWMDSVAHSDEEDVQKVRDFQLYLHMKDFDFHGARLYSDTPQDLFERFSQLEMAEQQFAERRDRLVRSLVKYPLDQCDQRVAAFCKAILNRNSDSTSN